VRYLDQRERVVFASGAQAPTTRIPALLALADGALLAFAELRATAADAGAIGIGVRRSTDAGGSWGPPVVVCGDGVDTFGNPVPVQLPSGRILVLSTWNRAADTERAILDGTSASTRRVHLQHSDDGGLSWSAPADLTAQVKRPGWRWYATGPGAVEVLASGRVLIPANHSDPGYGGGAPYRSHVIYSDDGGESWAVGGVVAKTGTNEAQLTQTGDGDVLLYLRDELHGGKRLAVSGDGGLSFGRARRLPFTGPACHGDILRLDDGSLLVTDHAHRKRARLAVRRSDDGGATWGAGVIVRQSSSAYADLARLPDGDVGILFEAGRDIVFGRLAVTAASSASAGSAWSSSP
jgi:sialidase-1